MKPFQIFPTFIGLEPYKGRYGNLEEAMHLNTGREKHLETGPERDISPSDARLVEETRQGEAEAFGQLVQRYERRLIRVILQFCNDPILAEDLAQETFLRAYLRLNQFDPSRRFSSWLFRIGINITLDHHRKRRRFWNILFTDKEKNRPIDPATADPRIQQNLSQEIRVVINRIPEKYRTVLILRDLENFSTSEIAAILGRREATIRWRLAEARNRFQDLWEKQQQT